MQEPLLWFIPTLTPIYGIVPVSPVLLQLGLAETTPPSHQNISSSRVAALQKWPHVRAVSDVRSKRVCHLCHRTCSLERVQLQA